MHIHENANCNIAAMRYRYTTSIAPRISCTDGTDAHVEAEATFLKRVTRWISKMTSLQMYVFRPGKASVLVPLGGPGPVAAKTSTSATAVRQTVTAMLHVPTQWGPLRVLVMPVMLVTVSLARLVTVSPPTKTQPVSPIVNKQAVASQGPL